MNALKNLSTLFLSTLLLSGVSATRALAADDTFELRFPVDEPLVLDADTGSGSIEIRSGAGDEVSIEGKIRVRSRFLRGKPGNADELIQQVKDNPPVEMDDGRLSVGPLQDRTLRDKVNISYEIVAPAGTEVFAQTGSGSISVVDIAAPVDIRSGSGGLMLENIAGPAKARAGSGAIHAEGVGGAFNGKTGSGSIYLRQTEPGDVVVSTGSGSSELLGVIGSVSASSGSGQITIDGRQEGDWMLDTGSGSVRVSLPADAAFDFDATTSSGGIEIDHPLTTQGRLSKKHVVGQVRGGGPRLEIDTRSGGIRVN